MEKLVFDIGNNLMFPISNVIILIIFFTICIIIYSKKILYTNRFLKFIICSAFAIFLIITYFNILEFYNIKEIIREKNFYIEKGRIENFIEAPYSGHKKERFTLNGKEFAYSDYEKTYFYHITKNHGGYIKNNKQKIKVAYIIKKYKDICIPFTKLCLKSDIKENKIVKLWIYK